MKKLSVITFTSCKIACVLLFISLAVMSYKMPEGWFKAGSKPDDYEMGTDPGSGQNGNNAATIKSTRHRINGFGTLMQNITPEIYKGKRVRLTAYLKAEDVDSWAGLWLRVDGLAPSKSVSTIIQKEDETKKVISKVSTTETRKTLAFDNMYNRAITGTVSWTKCEIVLDVADSATNIAFGALLSGTGQLWFDNLKFDTVSKDIPTTSSNNKLPVNLNFDK